MSICHPLTSVLQVHWGRHKVPKGVGTAMKFPYFNRCKVLVLVVQLPHLPKPKARCLGYWSRKIYVCTSNQAKETIYVDWIFSFVLSLFYRKMVRYQANIRKFKMTKNVTYCVLLGIPAKYLLQANAFLLCVQQIRVTGNLGLCICSRTTYCNFTTNSN